VPFDLANTSLGQTGAECYRKREGRAVGGEFAVRNTNIFALRGYQKKNTTWIMGTGLKQNMNEREDLSLFVLTLFLQQLESSTTMAKHALVSKEGN